MAPAGKKIDLRQHFCSGNKCGGLLKNSRYNLSKQLLFAAVGTFLSVEYFLLLDLQFLGIKTLGIGQRLFANVALGDKVEVGVADLYEITKGPVVLDF